MDRLARERKKGEGGGREEEREGKGRRVKWQFKNKKAMDWRKWREVSRIKQKDIDETTNKNLQKHSNHKNNKQKQ